MRWLAFLVGLAIRGLAVFCLAPMIPTHGDANMYVNLARHWLEHGSVIQPEMIDIRPPLYTLLVSLGLDTGQSPPSPFPRAYLLQIVFELGTVFLASEVARRRFGARAAAATAWLGALSPSTMLYSSTLILAESVTGFFPALALLLLDRNDATPRPLAALVIGLVLAVGTQMKELALVVVLLLVVVDLVDRRTGTLGARARAAACIGVGLAVGLAPWTVATARATGRPLPTGTYGYWALMYDNAPLHQSGHLLWTAQPDREAAIALAKKTFHDALLEYPSLTAQRAANRLRVFFGPESFAPTSAIAYPIDGFVPDQRTLLGFYRSTWRLPDGWGRMTQLVAGAWSWLVFTLAAAGAALAMRSRVARTFVLLVLVFLVVVALTVASDRYRQGLVPFALPLAGLAVTRAFGATGDRWTRAATITAIVVGVGLFLSMFVLSAPNAPVP